MCNVKHADLPVKMNKEQKRIMIWRLIDMDAGGERNVWMFGWYNGER
jgi:hypothetical protein